MIKQAIRSLTLLIKNLSRVIGLSLDVYKPLNSHVYMLSKTALCSQADKVCDLT